MVKPVEAVLRLGNRCLLLCNLFETLGSLCKKHCICFAKINCRTCEVTSWAHIWKLRFNFFEPGYDRNSVAAARC
jgi:hypothetical protein